MFDEQKEGWAKLYKSGTLAYPSEYVIRMLKGNYPKLNFIKNGYKNKSILEVGCGDGRHMPLFKSLGFSKIAGTEITDEICNITVTKMSDMGVEADIKVGKNSDLPFEDRSFDFLLSWNVCYYLDEEKDFHSHVEEYSRVLKNGGVLLFSIPTKKCFVYKDGVEKDGFMEIRDDWFGLRNGSIQRVFEDEEEIEQAFGSHFKDFTFGHIEDDCFGLSYSWFIGYCYKR